MFKDNLSPLEQFQTYKDKFREIAEKPFDELTIASRINIEDNRILCKEIQDLESENEKTTTTFGLWTLLCILMWIVTITCIIICISKGFENGWIIPTLCIICSVSMIILLFWKIHPIIKEYIAITNAET